MSNLYKNKKKHWKPVSGFLNYTKRFLNNYQMTTLVTSLNICQFLKFAILKKFNRVA